MLCANANVQEIWNVMENFLINICDGVAPMTVKPTRAAPKKTTTPPFIKKRLTKEKVCLKKKNVVVSLENCMSIRLLNIVDGVLNQ